jgi:hypothetical protein
MIDVRVLRHRLFVTSVAIACSIADSSHGAHQLAAAPQTGDAATTPEISPDLQQARLVVGAESLKPIRVSERWRREYDAGGFRVGVDGAEIIVRQTGEASPSWSTRSPDGKLLKWFGGEGGIAYFSTYEVDYYGQFLRYAEPLKIDRLDLKSKRWLEPLRPGMPMERGHRPGDILAALADDRRFVALGSIASAELSKDKNVVSTDDGRLVVSYVVSCFRHGETKPVWSRSFPAIPSPLTRVGFLLDTRTQYYEAADLRRLSCVGDRLLVCAEGFQPIECLDANDGSVLWSCERIWEYQRGLSQAVGSAPTNYITRFATEGVLDDLRAEFDKMFQCGIIGGPIAVLWTSQRSENKYSIFVATARVPKRRFPWDALPDCHVYELSEKGELISTVTLPQLTHGPQFHVVPDGLVWQGQDDSLMMLRVSNRPAGGVWVLGSDMSTQLAWFRQTRENPPAAWLLADRDSHRPIAFDGMRAVRLAAGGFVERKGDRVYQFPISIVNLVDGTERPGTLRVPFHGELPTPSTGLDASPEPGGPYKLHTTGTYQLWIEDLGLRGARLEVVLRTKERAMAVELDIAAACASGQSTHTMP